MAVYLQPSHVLIKSQTNHCIHDCETTAVTWYRSVKYYTYQNQQYCYEFCLGMPMIDVVFNWFAKRSRHFLRTTNGNFDILSIVLD